MHSMNHPHTEHYCESVWEVDPHEACRGRKIALMWLSPDCKHFSKAKGGKPVEKKIRGLAWVALRWASLPESLKPRVIIMENVEEIQTWGRLTKEGKPDERYKGETFKSFVNALRHNGYKVEWRECVAADYGAPTTRNRLVLIARSDGNSIVFPAATHGKGLKPYRTAAEIIDWSIGCPSIFSRKKPLVDNTMRRIAKGLDKFVIKSDKPFIIPIGYGERKGQSPRVHDIEKPLSTVVSSCKQYLIAHTLTKFNDQSPGQAVDVPLDTVMAGATRFGKVETVMLPFVEQANFNNTPVAANAPLSTLTTVNHHRLVEAKISPFINKCYGGNYKGSGASVEKPLPAVTTQDHNALMMPSLIQYHTETSANETRAYGLDAPISTVDCSNRYGLSAAFMSQYYTGGGSAQAAGADKPLRTIVSNDKNIVVQVKLSGDARDLGHWDKIRKLLNKYAGYNIADDEILLFSIDNILYFISDIGMRMLVPRELYNAQGFPADYIIEFNMNGKAYSKKDQIARCGNAVCPPLAEAVVRANLPELCGKRFNTMSEFNSHIAYNIGA